MTDEEYKEFLLYLYQEHIERKIARIRNELHPIDILDQKQNYIPRLTKAVHVLRFIEDYFDEEEERKRSLTSLIVDKTVEAVEDGARYNNRLTVDTGIVDVIEDHFAEIVEGMSVDHFPKEDFEVFRESGFSDPRRELSALIRLLKLRKERMQHDKLIRLLGESRQVRFSEELEKAPELIARLRKSLKEESAQLPEQKSVSRKIWKGLANICQGALLSITDVTLMMGLWQVMLPPEATTVGAVTSITGGVGKLMEGVGDIRGEG